MKGIVCFYKRKNRNVDGKCLGRSSVVLIHLWFRLFVASTAQSQHTKSSPGFPLLSCRFSAFNRFFIFSHFTCYGILSNHHLIKNGRFQNYLSSFSKTTIMKADAILNADVLDIKFENRNKDYGAYSLRKFYNNRLYKALSLTFAAAALLMLFSFINKGKVEAPLIVGGVVTLSPPPVKADPVPEKPKEKAAPQKTATPQVPPAAQKFTTNLQIIKDNIAPPIEDLNEGLAINNINVVGKRGEAALVMPKVPDAPSGGGDAEVTKPAVDKITPIMLQK